jgi:hypothetical protein
VRRRDPLGAKKVGGGWAESAGDRGRRCPGWPVLADPWEFQAECVEAFVASWTVPGFSPVAINQ